MLDTSHNQWKGDLAGHAAGHRRARVLYPLGPCERCSKAGVERHHRDGNPLNNERENVQVLCRRCHMVVDGRLTRSKPPISQPRTHCKRGGHELTPDNVIVEANGARRCRKCREAYRARVAA